MANAVVPAHAGCSEGASESGATERLHALGSSSVKCDQDQSCLLPRLIADFTSQIKDELGSKGLRKH